MKRAVLLALALAVAAVPLAASEAGAADGRPQHDRDELIDFAREHGQTVAVPRDNLGAGLTQDGLFDACQVQNFTDPTDGLNVDVASFTMAHDCGTATWALSLAASASFNANTFDYTLVYLDTDLNAGTGDLGDDYTVVAFFDDDNFNLAVIKTPTSSSATWSVTGTPGFAQNQNLLSLLWRQSDVGSPSQFRWNGEFSTLVDAGIDVFPNAGYVTTTTPSLPPGPALGQPGKFVPVTPTRIMDTRSGGAATKPFTLSTLRQTVAGVGPVPADAIAVALNVTATETEGSGFVGVFPNGTAWPGVSSLNFTRSGQTIANLVVTPIGSQGKVSFYVQQATHLVADVMGYWVPAASSTDGRYQPLQPARILDTRSGAKPGSLQTIPFAVNGQGGVPASGVSAVVLNLTLTESTAAGWAAAFPGGTAWSGTSNLNVLRAGQTVPNLVIVPVGANGMVNLLTMAGGHLVADVAGYFTDASAPATSSGLFVSQHPNRLADTRPANYSSGGAPTGLIPSNGSIAVNATVAGIPAGAGAALLNVTNTENRSPGFVTVYPAEPRPFVSNLNMEGPNQTVPNAVVATLSNGTFRVYSQPGSHVVIDTSGYFTA